MVDIKTYVDQAMRDWEPSIYVQSISPVVNVEHTGIARIEVQYTRVPTLDYITDATSVFTAIIHEGGEITEIS
jgi:hypothetical protein